MSVHSVQSSQQVAQAEKPSRVQVAKNQASRQSAIPQDKVTISAAAQAKQTASAPAPQRNTVQISNAAHAALKQAPLL
jgi:hypothetical protein